MPAPRKVDREAFRKAASAGATTKALVAAFGIDASSACRLRRQMGISSPPRANAPLSPERHAVIEKCLADGWSFAEITRTHGVDPETLRKYWPGQCWNGKERAAYIRMLRNSGVKLSLSKYA